MDPVGRRGRSPLVVVAVLAAHALLLLGLLRVTVLREAAEPERPAPILLLDATDFAASAPSLPPLPVTDATPPAPQPPPATTDTAAGSAPPSADSGVMSGGPAPTGAPRGPVDWYRVGAAVARDRVERAAAAARPAPAPFRKAKEGPRSTTFDSGRRRRTGTSEKLADGQSIFWVNENCFVTTESDSLLQKDLHDAQRGMTRCVMRLGKREARGDLFDKLPNHERKLWPGDPTLPDSRGGTGPGGVPEPIPEPEPNAELEVIAPDSR